MVKVIHTNRSLKKEGEQFFFSSMVKLILLDGTRIDGGSLTEGFFLNYTTENGRKFIAYRNRGSTCAGISDKIIFPVTTSFIIRKFGTCSG